MVLGDDTINNYFDVVHNYNSQLYTWMYKNFGFLRISCNLTYSRL